MRGTFDTSDRPILLIYELTQACDLTCHHCRASAQPNRHPDELTTAEAKRLLDQAREFGEGQLVVFSGGDPLKRDDVVELVQYGTDIGLRMTLTPSGTRHLTPAVIDDLADAGLAQMAVSLDGARADAHDAFREVSGSFEETMAAARHAQDVGLPLQVNTTVVGETVDDLPAIRDRVTEMGAVMWSVFFLVPIGRGQVLDPISPERAEAVWEWLADVSEDAPFRLKTTEAPAYRRVKLQREDDDPGVKRRSGVVAGDGFVFVSHRGEVYPSGFLPKSAGNVREESVVDVYRDSDLFTSLRDREQLTGKCGACPYRHVCGGSRSRAFATTGDPLASDPLCPFVPDDYDGPLPWETQTA